MHLPRIVTNIRARWTCVAADGVIEMMDYNKCTQHFVVFIDTLYIWHQKLHSQHVHSSMLDGRGACLHKIYKSATLGVISAP